MIYPRLSSKIHMLEEFNITWAELSGKHIRISLPKQYSHPVYPISVHGGTIFMTLEDAPVEPTCERRVQAVLALFRGEPVTQVSTQYKVCRRDLYKFRRRALAAIRQALTDHRRGPRRPHNRLAA